jgi:hypothetical protein
MLDTVTLYWLSATGGSSARFYWENFPPERSGVVAVPSAVTVFPRDIEKLPRKWSRPATRTCATGTRHLAAATSRCSRR